MLLLMLISTKINAQKFTFGIHASPALNYISTNDNDAENNTTLKFGFGLLTEYKFADNYSLSTGIDIVKQGGELKLRDTVGDYTAGYVKIPLLLKMRTRQFGYITYYGKFGGGISIKTDEEVSFSPDLSEKLDSYINPINVNFAIGGGLEYSLGGSTSLTAGIIYNRSLVDNLTDKNDQLDSNSQYRFDNVSLTLGVIF